MSGRRDAGSAWAGADPGPLPAVLHLDGGRVWAGGQNQVRLLMRELAVRGVRQLCVCPRGSPLEAWLRVEGLPVEGVPWRGAFGLRAVLAAAWRAQEFDVVHCHDAHALQVALGPARLLGVPVVATRRMHFRGSGFTWGRADRVIAISEWVRAGLLRSGVRPGRIRCVPSGIDPAEVAALPPARPPLRARLGLGPGDFLVGNVGHLHPFKGQEAIPAAAARVPGVHWAIVGEGPLRAALERAVAARGVGDRVHLVGALPDARRVLREFDLFVFPSLREPLGTSVLDAMAAGVPVVAADAAGPAEVLGPVHRRTGATLFPPGDAEALAALVERVRADPTLRRAMVEAQAERIRDFTAAAMAAGVLAVYREALREAGR